MQKPARAYILLSLFALSTGMDDSWSQYPARPVRIVVSVAPGGGIDVIGRLIAPRLSEALRQPVLVENKTGANGIIAVQAVSSALPDGTMVLLESRAIAMHPATNGQLPYDAAKGLEPVAHILSLPYVVVVNRDLGVRSIGELIEYAKKNPGKLNYAQAGTSTRLSGEAFRLMAAIDIAFIPYKGAVPASQAVLSGESHLSILDPVTVVPQVASGRLRALAVTSVKRFSLLPDVPTMQEAGLPRYVEVGWYGVFAPGGTLSTIVKALNAELNRVVMLPDLAPRISSLGMEPVAISQEAFAEFFRNEMLHWKDVVSRANLPLE